MAVIQVDQVVTAQGIVISKSPTLVVQPLETSIVRSIDVHAGRGRACRPGSGAARSDLRRRRSRRLVAQVASLQAQVDAHAGRSGQTGRSPTAASIRICRCRRRSMRSASRSTNYKLENYQQKVDSLVATIARPTPTRPATGDRLAVAQDVEKMRRELEKLQVGSRLNTLAAMDNRAEMARNLASAQEHRRRRAARSRRAARRARRLRPALACRRRRQAGRGGQQTVGCARAAEQGAAAPPARRAACRPRRAPC